MASYICLLHLAGIKNFTVEIIIRVSSEEHTMRRERSYVNKLNLALVQVRYMLYINEVVLICSRY